MNAEQLEHNLVDVHDRMNAACERAGRDPATVRLVAVTKTVDVDVARALIGLGVHDLGENRIQEAKRKQDEMADLDVTWHMIGHLQTNKAREAARRFALIHSVDSVHVAEALDRRGELSGEAVPVLVQINVSGEGSKSGLPAERAPEGVRRIAALDHLAVRGLMTMAPFVEDPETVRPVFRSLRELADRLRETGLAIEVLSMGMTQDFEVAIEEGATLIRVGTALFRGGG
jgi:hypothetical protein